MPAAPGSLALVDDENSRCGAVNPFAAVEPFTGMCVLETMERRTAGEMARLLRSLAAEIYAASSVSVLVMDNPTIQSLSCLVEACHPNEVRRLAQRFEVHPTPKHGSWRKVAEILLSVLSRECLDPRIATIERLEPILIA